MRSNILVDSNIIIDIFTNDPNWADLSQNILDEYSNRHILCINPIIYNEISIGFNLIEELETALDICNFKLLEIPKSALFLAGKVFLSYRKNKESKTSPLPDFFVGAHGSVLNIPVITRDANPMQYYFPKLKIISP